MKYFVFLLLVISFFCSCKKDPPPIIDPSPFWGTASAMVNGKSWVAKPTAWVDIVHGNSWYVEIDSFDRFNILRESLSLLKVPFTPGKYLLVNTNSQIDDTISGASFTYSEADVLYGYYQVLESDSSSFVTLESYDSVTQELKGRFDITFIAVHKPYASAADTLRVRNGIFHTKVREK